MKLNEEILRIKQVMGLLVEQTACQWENYVNGDGITRPKITIEKDESGITGTYEGPETGFCIQHSKGKTNDSMHQLAGVVSKVTADYLKELYRQGTYVYPDLENITMTKRDKFFKIYIPFQQTTEDKAITNFNERGGWGHDPDTSDPEKNTLQPYLNSISDKTKYDMISVEQKVASGGKSRDITEYWVSFRNIEDFPIKNDNSDNSDNNDLDNNNLDNNNLDNNDSDNNDSDNNDLDNNVIDAGEFNYERTNLAKLIDEIKLINNLPIDKNSVKISIDPINNKYRINFKLGNDKYQQLRLALNTIDDKKKGMFPSKEEFQNLGYELIKGGTFQDKNGARDYAFMGLKSETDE